MKTWQTVGAVSLAQIAFSGSAIAQNAACAALEGAKVVTSDGTYLGRITSSYGQDSIFNSYSTYGSPFSSTSIWNDYGTYGSEYSSTSARSDYATDPPLLIKNGELVGYLSTNKYKPGAVNPMLLGVVCYDYEPD
jgi:hypothetical protein